MSKVLLIDYSLLVNHMQGTAMVCYQRSHIIPQIMNNPGSGAAADSCNVSFIPRHHLPAVQPYAGSLPVIKPSPGEVLAHTLPAAAITRPPPTSD